MHSAEKARLEMLLRKMAVSKCGPGGQSPFHSPSVRHSKPVRGAHAHTRVTKGTKAGGDG